MEEKRSKIGVGVQREKLGSVNKRERMERKKGRKTEEREEKKEKKRGEKGERGGRERRHTHIYACTHAHIHQP